MARTIVIVGGLNDATDRDELLGLLQNRAPGVNWDWVKPVTSAFNLPPRPFRRLLAQLQNKGTPQPIVVKLYGLHGREANQLYCACPDPVLPPAGFDTGEALCEWLLSRDANLVPRLEWNVNRTEAALLAILAKLIRNKSWNQDGHGHQWTKEEDLLGQAPVHRSDFPEISETAAAMIHRLKGSLLLCKGGKQGKTPRGWSIRLTALPSVKRCIVEQSFAPLRVLPALTSFVDECTNEVDRPYRADKGIVTERVRQVCNDPREIGEDRASTEAGR